MSPTLWFPRTKSSRFIPATRLEWRLTPCSKSMLARGDFARKQLSPSHWDLYQNQSRGSLSKGAALGRQVGWQKTNSPSSSKGPRVASGVLSRRSISRSTHELRRGSNPLPRPRSLVQPVNLRTWQRSRARHCRNSASSCGSVMREAMLAGTKPKSIRFHKFLCSSRTCFRKAVLQAATRNNDARSR